MKAEPSLVRHTPPNTSPNNQERYRTILETIEDGYYEVDLEGNLTFFNPAMQNMLGYSGTELQGMNYRQFTEPEIAQHIFKVFNQVFRTGEPAKEIDWRLVGKDQKTTYISASVSLMQDQYGEYCGFFGIARDVTERTEIQQALRQSEETLHAFFKTAPDAIFIKDLSLRYLRANQAASSLFNVPPELVTGKTDKELNRPNYEMAEEIDRRVLQGEKIEQDANLVINGKQHIFHIIKVPLRNTNGAIAGICGIARDITDRVEARRLAESRATDLASLSNTAAYLNQSISIDVHIEKALENAAALIGSQAAWLCVPNEDQHLLIASHGFSPAIEVAKDGFTKCPACACQKKFATGELTGATSFEECAGLHTITPELCHIASIPLRVGGQVLGLLNLADTTHKTLDDEQLRSLTALGDLFGAALERIRLFEQVQYLASVDSLTGIYNRRKFFELGEQVLQHAVQNDLQTALLMLDIDFYKHVNDTYSHAAGDVALKAVTDACKQSLRTNDMMGRYGGDEFFALLTDTNEHIALTVAERLRTRVENLTILFDEYTIQVTISVGVAMLTPDLLNLDRLVMRADAALYHSKNNGRNRVTFWSPEEKGS